MGGLPLASGQEPAKPEPPTNYGFAAVGRRGGGGNLNIFQTRCEVDF